MNKLYAAVARLGARRPWLVVGVALALSVISALLALRIQVRTGMQDMMSPDDPMVELENDKPTVIALREIADGHVTSSILEEVELPPEVEFMPPEASEEVLPVRGISIGD